MRVAWTRVVAMVVQRGGRVFQTRRTEFTERLEVSMRKKTGMTVDSQDLA